MPRTNDDTRERGHCLDPGARRDQRNLPFCLIIMDGYGIASPGPGNAVTLARTPNLDALRAEWPATRLRCSGLAVGLPEGQMGNSEVGHLNIGAGRVVFQELTRVNLAIEDGTLLANEVLGAAMDAATTEGGAVHFMGLVSDGGVHSHQKHLYALLRMAALRGATKVYVHCFLDGRDVPPESGARYIADLEKLMAEVGVGRVATLMGRYWAMDRDNRWDRVEKAWRAMVLGDGVLAEAAVPAIQASYREGVTDEFVAPTVLTRATLVQDPSATGADQVARPAPVARIEDGDALIFFNFRPDRAREITRAFVDRSFADFARPCSPKVHFVCLTEYDPTITAPVAFPKDLPRCVLADALSEAGLRQLHTAETEKYAHVTFFLNGGVESPKPGEERVLVPSPKVATYDLKPEMSAPEVTARLVDAIERNRADVYVVNYANCDMVGHTGVLAASIKAVETVDAGVGAVVSAIRKQGGGALVTADHGNAERMVDSDGRTPFTAHTSDDVPLIAVVPGVKGLKHGGILADVAPTLLDAIGLDQPPMWTGTSRLLY